MKKQAYFKCFRVYITAFCLFFSQSLLGRWQILRCRWWLQSSYPKCTRSSPWPRYCCNSFFSYWSIREFYFFQKQLIYSQVVFSILFFCGCTDFVNHQWELSPVLHCVIWWSVPELLQVYSIRTRSRAVEIFTTCANLICAIEELEKVSCLDNSWCFSLYSMDNYVIDLINIIIV